MAQHRPYMDHWSYKNTIADRARCRLNYRNARRAAALQKAEATRVARPLAEGETWWDRLIEPSVYERGR